MNWVALPWRLVVQHTDFWPMETVHILLIIIHQCWSSNNCMHSFKNQGVPNFSKIKFWSLNWWNKVIEGNVFPLASYNWIHDGFWNSWPWRLLSSFVFRVGKSAMFLLQLHMYTFEKTLEQFGLVQIHFHFPFYEFVSI